jgi:hypothetical protein
MIALLDTSHDLDEAAAELGCEVGQLLTPLTRFKFREGVKWAGIDNGAFAGLDVAAFEALLEREESRRKFFKFVACPDVPFSARRTLELFEYWMPRLEGWPIAYVAQDGQEDLPLPWEFCAAVFIGGSTKWKGGPHAAAIIAAARAMRKWVHVGRVNTPARFEYFEGLGADSIDGTGLARYSHMRTRIYEASQRPKLFDEREEAAA